MATQGMNVYSHMHGGAMEKHLCFVRCVGGHAGTLAFMVDEVWAITFMFSR